MTKTGAVFTNGVYKLYKNGEDLGIDFLSVTGQNT
jgi:hypothetical protein